MDYPHFGKLDSEHLRIVILSFIQLGIHMVSYYAEKVRVNIFDQLSFWILEHKTETISDQIIARDLCL